MNLDKLEKILAKEPKFRFSQIKKAVFVDLIEDWEKAAALPKSLRTTLNKQCPLKINSKLFASKDKKTIKALIILEDGQKIESVLMRHNERNTICVSSQVGCPMKCAFCATGQMGFKRDLSKFEIIEQVLLFSRLLKKNKERITNIVFMGMGEPFLNYENVLAAIRYLHEKDTLNLGARKFSISTCGVIEGIKKLAEENLEVNLAISLHAPNDELRDKLMPINKLYPLSKLMPAIKDYLKKTNRKAMIEYIMIKDVNDSPVYAKQLADLLGGMLCVVNLITYNPTKIYKPSSALTIKKFKQILESHKVNVVQRYKYGADIHAACGQLAGNRD